MYRQYTKAHKVMKIYIWADKGSFVDLAKLEAAAQMNIKKQARNISKPINILTSVGYGWLAIEIMGRSIWPAPESTRGRF